MVHRSPPCRAPLGAGRRDDDDDEDVQNIKKRPNTLPCSMTTMILEILEDDDDVERPRRPDPDSRRRGPFQSSRAAGRRDTRTGTTSGLTRQPTSRTRAASLLSRSGPVTVEELDLAPMVDVALQLVLFFMVTATTVLFKTLEIPKPSTDAPPSGVIQGRSRSLDDFQKDYILVEIDPSGMMKIDREPVAANMTTLVERLRTAREKTGRKSMLLSADFATKHRNSVLAYDAANEIGLGIVIARPQAPQGPAPALAPAATDAAGRKRRRPQAAGFQAAAQLIGAVSEAA